MIKDYSRSMGGERTPTYGKLKGLSRSIQFK